MARILGWGGPAKVSPSASLEPVREATSVLEPVLADFLESQAGVVEQAARLQGVRLEQAEGLMAEAVLGFGESLKKLDVLVNDQYRLAMELKDVMDLRLDGEEGAQSMSEFTTSILKTLNLFVQAMLETGQSSFQLVEDTDGIRSRSNAMGGALGELAEVASRIQMLALNAAIEAAHARQYGAGFAVVAGEVGKLAVRSTRISDQISAMVLETESALERTSAQVQVIASKDLNEIIHSKKMADAMVGAIGESDQKAQELVARMEQVGREVRDQVAFSLSAMQFEDMVRQMLQNVALGCEQLARFALRIRTLAGDVARGDQPIAGLLAQATLDFSDFRQETFDSVHATTMSAGAIELF